MNYKLASAVLATLSLLLGAMLGYLLVVPRTVTNNITVIQTYTAASASSGIQSTVSDLTTYVLTVAAIAAITLVLELAILVRK